MGQNSFKDPATVLCNVVSIDKFFITWKFGNSVINLFSIYSHYLFSQLNFIHLLRSFLALQSDQLGLQFRIKYLSYKFELIALNLQCLSNSFKLSTQKCLQKIVFN